jgi:hypothetical protein
VPTPSSGQTAGWPAYSNSTYHYSLKYPTGWYDVPNGGAPSTDKYFANQNVGAPLQMVPGGIWLTVRVAVGTATRCAPSGTQGRLILSQKTTTVSGYPATEYELGPGGPSASYDYVVSVNSGQSCFGLDLLTWDASASAQWSSTFEGIRSAVSLQP